MSPSLLQTYCAFKDWSQFKKMWNQWYFKNPHFPALVNWQKFRSTTNWEKNVFNWKKKNFKPIGSSEHTAHTAHDLKKFDLLMFYLSRQPVKWKRTSSTCLHSTMISWWTGSSIYVKFNVYNVIKNYFGHLLNCRCVTSLVRIS